MSTRLDTATIQQRLLWVPTVAAFSAGLLSLARAISSETALLIASLSWVPWWIAAFGLGLRSRSSNTTAPKSVGYSLLIGCAVSYGVIWGLNLT